MPPRDSHKRLRDDVVACTDCPRLVAHRESVTGEGSYWNRAVPGFGDRAARLLVIGLAPGAHGANRTGRPFTGDFAGEWLYRALHEFGLASRPKATSLRDGMKLDGVWITNALRCVPPENKPTGAEVRACSDFLARELALLKQVDVVFALGKVAHDAFLAFVKNHVDTSIKRKSYPFGHAAVHTLPGRPQTLVDTYHSSRYNVSTKVLKWEMFVDAMGKAVELMPAVVHRSTPT